MVTIEFNRPIVYNGMVGDRMIIPCEEDVHVVGTDSIFAILKLYYMDKSVEFRYANEKESNDYKIKKLTELTGIKLNLDSFKSP